ncbi:sensor domain-containing diguanylate cyclase [Alkalilimnicola sp. S0819]|uniref:sensor domain-containing diguanylate cyclase n=1 Tax=Alkalilimnicola sp. S0819 TaxID=2613922 RepID=UPI00126196A4|nr:sensor domain-containing diguanylate cyclase [Alkalilimnicola sp. S0819]KAB7624100.1 diguanylate cyclase [Alkalilimnicola sp. S0819]MPQ16351.1 diguanylate cyclase [Alkalilimnicola sp. S0819]
MQQQKLYASLGLAALLLLGFLATSLISYFVAQDSLTERIADETLPLTSDNIYSEIERDLLRSTLISSLMAHDTFVRDWTLAGEEQPERIIRYLDTIQHKYATTTAFFVSERTRRYYHPDGMLKTIDEDDPADAWYFRVRALREPYEVNIDQDTADRSRVSIFVNYRVLDYQGDYLGAIGIGLAVNRVTELVQTYQERYGRHIYFIDRAGRITLRGGAYAEAERIQEVPGLKRLATYILATPSASLSYERANGETAYVNSRLIPELDWHLIVEQTSSQTETRILNTLLINVLFALTATVIVLLLARFTIRGYQRRLEDMAMLDPLTGAANRQVFGMIFERTVKAAQRRGEPVSVITIDLDHFKAINDTYGHRGGDVAIREFARIVRGCIRETDVLCRWGGDEFVVLLSDCRIEGAEQLAGKIRKAVNEQPISYGRDTLAITVSQGMAQHRPGEALDELVARADAALYASKAEGRDRYTAG